MNSGTISRPINTGRMVVRGNRFKHHIVYMPSLFLSLPSKAYNAKIYKEGGTSNRNVLQPIARLRNRCISGITII
jgi:hypothetical protein